MPNIVYFWHMAKLKLTALVSDIAGSVGGSIFAKAGNTHYIRTKTTPVNKVSPTQGAQRQFIGSLTQSWRNLNPNERMLWSAFALNQPTTNRVGDKVTLSGFNWYIKLNSNLHLAGEPIILIPPLVTESIFISGLFFSIVNATNSLAVLHVPPIPINYAYIVYATVSIPLGRKIKDNEYRFIQASKNVGSIIAVLTVNYSKIFGAVGEVGSHIWFKVYAVNLISGMVSDSIIRRGKIT